MVEQGNFSYSALVECDPRNCAEIVGRMNRQWRGQPAVKYLATCSLMLRGWISGRRTDRQNYDSIFRALPYVSRVNKTLWMLQQMTRRWWRWWRWYDIRIEVRPTALLLYHAHTRSTLTFDLDLWPWISSPNELWPTRTIKLKLTGQLVQKIEWVETNGRTDGQTAFH